jgi:hypothetical protein
MGSPGGNMKTTFMLLVLVSGALLESMHAATKTVDQTATVISVEGHETQYNSNYAGTNSSDFPLQSEIYRYDITARVGSAIYRTSYDSALAFPPSVFADNRPIQVNLRKHVMYVTVPDEGEVRLSIENRSGVQSALRNGRR